MSFSSVDGISLKFHNKIINTRAPMGPEFKKVSVSSNKLLLTFEDSTSAKRVKITITAFSALTALIKFCIIVIYFVLLHQTDLNKTVV